MEPVFFATPADLRAWFAQHGANAAELLVGFRKVGSGQPSVTWPESVDEALCFGWIDGVRRRVDDTAYTVRFTPRRKGSIWSAVNIGRVAVLRVAGRLQPAGEAAFAARQENRSNVYAYENRPAELPAAYAAILRADAAAWAFFEAQPPGYRRTAIWQIVSAKQEATQRKRLEKLVVASAEGRRLF